MQIIIKIMTRLQSERMTTGLLLCGAFVTRIQKLRLACQNQKKRSSNALATRSEYEKVSTNWIESKVPQSKIYNKRELNLKPNEIAIDMCDHSWGTNSKTLMDF